MAAAKQSIATIAKQVATPAPQVGAWCPPAIGDLIQRIDIALRERRAA